MVNQPFFPQYGRTVSIVSASGAVNGTLDENTAESGQLLIQNVGTVLCFFRSGAVGSPDATTTDLPIPPNGSIVISKSRDEGADRVSKVSIFSTGAGSTVYVTPGEGYGP